MSTQEQQPTAMDVDGGEREEEEGADAEAQQEDDGAPDIAPQAQRSAAGM
jgi:hypothetical protein